MKKPSLSPASNTPCPATDGAHVTIALTRDDGSETVLSGKFINEPTKRRLGILLSGRFYFGRANLYSRNAYRLLINGRIIIARASEVQLILLTD